MNQTTRKRIEDIKNGIVPEGYKKTKAGIVPIEWEEKRIGDVLTQRKTLRCVSEDVPLLSFTIEEGVIEPENKKSNKRDFLIKDINTKKFALTEVGDIIYNPANLKFGAIHRNNLRRGVVSPIYGIFHGAQNSVYMSYLLRNQRFIDYAKIYAEGTVEKLKTLSADTFKKLKITLPCLAEQKKIGTVLETQDKVIKLKEKLIEQKKQQKKYLMQQLLTGKKRLPGFMDEWTNVSFKQVYQYAKEGGTPSTEKEAYYENGKIPFVKIENLSSKYICSCETFITEEGLNNSSAWLIPKNNIIFSNGATIGKVSINKIPVSTKQGILGIIPKSTFSMELLYYYFSSRIFLDDVMRITTHGTMDVAYLKDINNIKLIIPMSKEEQDAIADILINADYGIELLQKDLEEEIHKKKALMQLLLTGIVRSV